MKVCLLYADMLGSKLLTLASSAGVKLLKPGFKAKLSQKAKPQFDGAATQQIGSFAPLQFSGLVRISYKAIALEPSVGTTEHGLFT